MPNPKDLSNEELEDARDLGAATYLSAYVHLMARRLDVDDSDTVAVNQMAVAMIPVINLATEAAWRASMKDRTGAHKALKDLRDRIMEMMQQ